MTNRSPDSELRNGKSLESSRDGRIELAPNSPGYFRANNREKRLNEQETPNNALEPTLRNQDVAGPCKLDDSALDAEAISDLTPAEQLQALAALMFIKNLRPGFSDQAAEEETTCFANQEPNEFSAPSLPSKIGKYEIVRSLGRGGFAEVFLAFDPSLDREVALKVPLIVGASDRHSQQRFQREAKAAALLSHPSIVPVFEVGSIGAIDYIAFEYFPGTTLAQFIESTESGIDQRVAASVVAALADAIEHAHQRGVIHRDLKPSNVLIDTRSVQASGSLAERVRIADFGLAYRQSTNEPSITIEGTALGTPAYMSPEQAAGRTEPSRSSDIYALGMILYEMLTGQLPFRRSHHLATLKAVETEAPPSLRSFVPSVAIDLEAICQKCLAKDPSARYRSAMDLSVDLRHWLEGRPVSAKPLSPVHRTWFWVKRHRLISFLGSLLMATLVTGIGMTVWQAQVARNHLVLMERERARAESHLTSIEKSLDQILADLPVSLVDSARMSTQQRLLLERIVELQKDLLAYENTNDRMIGKSAVAQLKLARVFRELGQLDKAKKQIEFAENLVRQVPDDSDQYLGLQVFVAEALIERALMAYQGHDLGKSLDWLEQSNQILQSLEQTEVADAALVSQMRYLRTLGMVRERSFNLPAALLAFEEAVKLAELRLANGAPTFESHQTELEFAWASSLNSLAVLQARTADPETSVATYRSAKQIIEKILLRSPLNLRYLSLLSTIEWNLGNAAFRADQWEEARFQYQQGAQRIERLLESHPDDVALLQLQAKMLGMLGASKARLGDWSSARTDLERSMAEAKRLGSGSEALSTQLRSANNLARMLAEDLKLTDEAASIYAEVINDSEAAVKQYPQEISFVRSLALACGSLGNICLEKGDFEQCEEFFEKQKHVLREAIEKTPQDRELPNLWMIAQRDFSALRLSLGELDQARDALISIAELPPQSSDMAYRSARELLKMYLTPAPIDSEMISIKEWQVWRETVLDSCYRQLELAIENGFARPSILEHEDPVWEPLRSKERFQKILASMQHDR